MQNDGTLLRAITERDRLRRMHSTAVDALRAIVFGVDVDAIARATLAPLAMVQHSLVTGGL